MYSCISHLSILTLTLTLSLTLPSYGLRLPCNSLSQNRVVFLGAASDKQGEFWGYRYVTDEEASKLGGLTEDERGVYNFIEREGNKGIWFRDLKKRTPIEHARLSKLLKTLITRKLIKQENSVQGKNRKVYMLYELEPAREVTGGAFHSGHELDLEFVAQLAEVALAYLRKFIVASADEILGFISSTGISKVALSVDDTQVRARSWFVACVCVSLCVRALIRRAIAFDFARYAGRAQYAHLRQSNRDRGHQSCCTLMAAPHRARTRGCRLQGCLVFFIVVVIIVSRRQACRRTNLHGRADRGRLGAYAVC